MATKTTNKLIFSYDLNEVKNKIHFRTNIFKIENILIEELMRKAEDIDDIDEYEIELIGDSKINISGKFEKGNKHDLELELKKHIFDIHNKIDEAILDLIAINKKNTYVKDFYLQNYSNFNHVLKGKNGKYDKEVNSILRNLIGQEITRSSHWHKFEGFDFRICLGGDFVHIRGKFEKGNEDSFWKSLRYAMSTHTYLDFFLNYYVIGLQNSSWEFEVEGFEDGDYISVLYDAFAFNKKLMWEAIWHNYSVSECKFSNWFIKNLLVKKIQIAIEIIASDSPHLKIQINNEIASPSLMIRILKSTIGVKEKWFDDFISKYPNRNLKDLQDFIAEKDVPNKFKGYFNNFVKHCIPEYRYLRDDQRLLIMENFKSLQEIAFYATITSIMSLG